MARRSVLSIEACSCVQSRSDLVEEKSYPGECHSFQFSCRGKTLFQAFMSVAFGATQKKRGNRAKAHQTPLSQFSFRSAVFSCYALQTERLEEATLERD